MLDRTSSQTQIDILTSRFRSALRKSIEGIIEMGKVLIEAKEQLPHGQFLDWVEGELKFPVRDAQTLMYLARNEVISNAKNFAYLPPSPTALWELCQIPKPRLRELIADGTINPGMRIEDAVALRRGPSQERSPITPRLKREIAALVDAAILLGGADVVLGHIRELEESNVPTIKEFNKAATWAKKKLAQQRRRQRAA
jgi:hypothetical protein